MEDLKNTCKVSENAEKQLRTYDVRCRCSSIKRTSKKRVKELNSLKKYARDQFTVGLIESQIKYWLELQWQRFGVVNRKRYSRWRLVIQYDKNLIFIAEYPSISEASRATLIDRRNINANCKNYIKSAGNYIWKYKI